MRNRPSADDTLFADTMFAIGWYLGRIIGRVECWFRGRRG
jgi:hypothetical protein